MPSRWEQLLDQKPVPLLEALLEEVAKLLVRDLELWPLPVESIDAVTGSNAAEFLAHDAQRPSASVFIEAFRLACWELARELSMLDDYVRNRRYLDHGVAPTERDALLFVVRWLVEQGLALREATGNRVSRSDLVRCLERAQARWKARPAG